MKQTAASELFAQSVDQVLLPPPEHHRIFVVEPDVGGHQLGEPSSRRDLGIFIGRLLDFLDLHRGRCLRIEIGGGPVPRSRWATIHFVQNGERTWMFNERGELIIAELTPEGYHELDRAKLIAPTLGQLPQRGGVCWSHPAFANRHVFARNDEELVCADLSAR